MKLRSAIVAAGLVAMTMSVGTAVAAAPDTTPPTTPGNLRVTVTTPSSVTLAWNASTDNSGSFYYVIQPVGGWPMWTPRTQTSRIVSGLQPQTTHSYNVYAVDNAGNRSALSNTVTVTTLADTTPPTAPVLTVQSVVSTRISVNWTASFDDVSFPRYTLLVNGAPAVGALGRTLVDLTPSTSYSLVVIASDLSGNSTESNTVIATTPPITDFVAPTVPTNVRGRDDGGGCEAYIRWDGSTDDSTVPILYRLYANGALANQTIGSTNSVAFDRDLGPGVTEFTVTATDGAGNVSAPSAPFPLTVRGC